VSMQPDHSMSGAFLVQDVMSTAGDLEEMSIASPVDREHKGPPAQLALSQITMVADAFTLGIDLPNQDARRGVSIGYELLSRVDGSARFGFGTNPLKHPYLSQSSDSPNLLQTTCMSWRLCRDR